MKRFLSLLASLAVVFTVFSCDREEAPDHSVTASVSGMSFPGDGGTDVFTIATSGTWATESSVSWMSVSPAFGRGDASVTVTVRKNTSAAQRTGRIFVTNMADNKSRVIIPVAQGGNGEAAPDTPSDPDVPDTPEEGDVTSYSVIGSWDWSGGDKTTVQFGNFVVARSLHLTPDDAFKIRKDKSWTLNWGAGLPGDDVFTATVDTKVVMGQDGKNISVPSEGDYGKVKTHFHNFMIALLNMKIRQILHTDEKLGKISFKITQDLSVEYNRNLFKTKIKDIIIVMSNKYSNQNRNKIILNEIIKKVDKNNELISLLNLNYEDLYLDYYLKSNKESFKGEEDDESYLAHQEKLKIKFGSKYANKFKEIAESLIDFFYKCKKREAKKELKLKAPSFVNICDSIINYNENKYVRKINHKSLIDRETQTELHISDDE